MGGCVYNRAIGAAHLWFKSSAKDEIIKHVESKLVSVKSYLKCSRTKENLYYYVPCNVLHYFLFL